MLPASAPGCSASRLEPGRRSSWRPGTGSTASNCSSATSSRGATDPRIAGRPAGRPRPRARVLAPAGRLAGRRRSLPRAASAACPDLARSPRRPGSTGRGPGSCRRSSTRPWRSAPTAPTAGLDWHVERLGPIAADPGRPRPAPRPGGHRRRLVPRAAGAAVHRPARRRSGRCWTHSGPGVGTSASSSTPSTCSRPASRSTRRCGRGAGAIVVVHVSRHSARRAGRPGVDVRRSAGAARRRRARPLPVVPPTARRGRLRRARSSPSRSPADRGRRYVDQGRAGSVVGRAAAALAGVWPDPGTASD